MNKRSAIVDEAQVKAAERKSIVVGHENIVKHYDREVS